jgi:hypothetical protein
MNNIKNNLQNNLLDICLQNNNCARNNTFREKENNKTVPTEPLPVLQSRQHQKSQMCLPVESTGTHFSCQKAFR